MSINIDNKDLVNIKIYITKKINAAAFWKNPDGSLIEQNKVNDINRVSLRDKFLDEYISIKYPQYADSVDFRHELLKIIDKIIVKLYFVKYNTEVLKKNVSPGVLRQNFKGPRFYPYMSNIKYLVEDNTENSVTNENKATEKQIILLEKLLNRNNFLKFNYNLKDELTKDDCSIIINYLLGKSAYMDGLVLQKYFKSVYTDSLFNFLENQTVRESFKKSIVSYLLNASFFYMNEDELVTQEECNDLDRINLATDYLNTETDLIKTFLNKSNRKNFVLDAAYYIDRCIPKIYYILAMYLYEDEDVTFDSLYNFNPLKSQYTSKLIYKLSNYKHTDPDVSLKASMKQINYIYTLLNDKGLPLILKDHRNLNKRDASRIIAMLKENNLLTEYKESFFIERK